MQKKTVAAVAGLAAAVVLGSTVAALADTQTPHSVTTGTVQVKSVYTRLNLTTSYQQVDSPCPDTSWVATGGGYFYDAPFDTADDITVRGSQRNVLSSGVEAWHVSAKWDAAVPGESRAIAAEVVCMKFGS